MTHQHHQAIAPEWASSRRPALQRGAITAVGLLPCWAWAVPAPAAVGGATKLAKTTVKYIEISVVAGKDCQRCSQFVAGKTATDTGSCKIVEGEIAALAYCIAFSPKPRP